MIMQQNVTCDTTSAQWLIIIIKIYKCSGGENIGFAMFPARGDVNEKNVFSC